MLPISEQSTHSTLHQSQAAADDFEGSDEDIGEHDFESEHRSHQVKHEYLSTNLITAKDITMADVQEEETSQAAIIERLKLHKARVRFREISIGIIDPRSEYRAVKAHHDLHTMITEAQVKELGIKAEEVWHAYFNEAGSGSDPHPAPSAEQLGRYASRVLHDHMRLASQPKQRDPFVYPFISQQVKGGRGSKKREQKEKQKQTLAEAHYLMKECAMTVDCVAKRLKLKRGFLHRVRRHGIIDSEIAFNRRQRTIRFQKIHDRAREAIRKLLDTSDHPLRLRDFQCELASRIGLKVSRPWLGRFLRSEMNATYRKIKPIQIIQNAPASKFQRQVAASKFIDFLHKGYRLINIDESVIRYTDHRQRGWVTKDSRNQTTSSQRSSGVNIIAALCSTGELLYTINIGITNAHSFGFFLSKLCDHLDEDDALWRKKTVIILDNANYHRGTPTIELMKALKLPILFLGPYQFRMAPIEMVFNFIKDHDLNPLRTKLSSWMQFQSYAKELAVHISRMELNWGKAAFMHCLTAALEDLSLTDL